MAGRNAQQSRILHSAAGSTGTFDEIEEVSDLSGPDGSANVIITTHLRSTAEETLPGLAKYGTIQMTCNYIGATQQIALFDMFSTNADPEPFKLALPTSSLATTFDVFAFTASVTKCTFGAKVDDKQTVNFTLQISGAVVLSQNVATGSLA